MILMEMMLEVVIGVLVMEVDKVADMVLNMKVEKVADMSVKIPDEDYWCDWELVILMEMMLDVVMGVMDMEVDKVANIMVNMEVDWQVDWHGGKDVTLAIGAQISRAKFPTYTSGATWWPTF